MKLRKYNDVDNKVEKINHPIRKKRLIFIGHVLRMNFKITYQRMTKSHQRIQRISKDIKGYKESWSKYGSKKANLDSRKKWPKIYG